MKTFEHELVCNCDGCAESVQHPCTLLIDSIPDCAWSTENCRETRLYSLCSKCLWKAMIRINSIFAFPLDDKLNINYYGEEPDEYGYRKVES